MRSRGGFPFCFLSVNHPGFVASVAARNFFDDAATPPCGDASRGLWRAILFFSSLLGGELVRLRPLGAAGPHAADAIHDNAYSQSLFIRLPERILVDTQKTFGELIDV